MKYLSINTVNNSYGTGYYIHATIDSILYPEIGYYAISKKAAIKMYREKYNLIGKHLTLIEY